jgi:hypothetical protein
LHLEDFGTHYATTLARWRENLHARWDDARQLGHDETFLRAWDDYLAYCGLLRELFRRAFPGALPGALRQARLPPSTDPPADRDDLISRRSVLKKIPGVAETPQTSCIRTARSGEEAGMNTVTRRRKLLDFVVLNVGWIVCVVGAANGLFWAGPTFVACVLVLHVALLPAHRRVDRVLLLIATGAFGLAVDSLQVVRGVIAFPETAPRVMLLPIWMAALWPLLATTFDGALAWLRQRPLLAALFGFFGGPPGYIAASRLGALELREPLLPTLLSLAIGWTIVLPVALTSASVLSERLRIAAAFRLTRRRDPGPRACHPRRA